MSRKDDTELFKVNEHNRRVRMIYVVKILQAEPN